MQFALGQLLMRGEAAAAVLLAREEFGYFGRNVAAAGSQGADGDHQLYWFAVTPTATAGRGATVGVLPAAVCAPSDSQTSRRAAQSVVMKVPKADPGASRPCCWLSSDAGRRCPCLSRCCHFGARSPTFSDIPVGDGVDVTVSVDRACPAWTVDRAALEQALLQVMLGSGCAVLRTGAWAARRRPASQALQRSENAKGRGLCLELGAKRRMCDADEFERALPGRFPAQLGDAVFRHHVVDVVLAGADVRAR